MKPPILKIEEINRLIDHTYLHPCCSLQDVQVLCREALEHKFQSVCIPPYYVFTTKKLLKDSLIKVCTVISYPMGYSATGAKVEEIKRASNDGVDEVDVVANIAAIKNNDWDAVKNDLESITTISRMRNVKLNLILEMDILELEELKRLCEVANNLEVNYFQTFTGFSGTQVSSKDVRLLKTLANPQIGIKAMGKLDTRAKIEEVIRAGADRIGTSYAMKILAGNV